MANFTTFFNTRIILESTPYDRMQGVLTQGLLIKKI